MTNTNWRREFREARLKQWNGGSPYFPDWDKVEDFIQSTLDSALKDQKAELLEKMPNKRLPAKEGFSESNLLNFGFNDCLEIIKGLIKGDV